MIMLLVISSFINIGILVDLFSLMGHPTLQINALRLLLKLNNGLRESSVDHISGKLYIHIYIYI